MISNVNPFLFTSRVYPLDRSDVDTDQIIPKQFMAGISKQGLGKSLFFNWRYQHGDYATPVSDFILNDPAREGASILLARQNFGCGSSREHAQWALSDFGIRCIIAPSFADIFYQNCIYNQILPVSLSESQVDVLFARAADPDFQLSVNLIDQRLAAHGNGFCTEFSISDDNRHLLLNNLDSISLTEVFESDISAFEARHFPGSRP
ncbi:3-isopropylmalate dehydratase small subunit [Alteromonas sp. CYL-A6]|uniref:3-isopropylmalate dehydratase small subunit n=1 Tax=Alteromonas nitratireducens TaxID=3390813 RepID=UPI0034B7D872